MHKNKRFVIYFKIKWLYMNFTVVDSFYWLILLLNIYSISQFILFHHVFNASVEIKLIIFK